MKTLFKINHYIKHSSLLFKDIYFFKSIDSTNNQCFKIKNKNNFIILAGRQSQGRGRYSRKWSSPYGNLYFSFFIHKPAIDYNEIVMLTSIALLEVLKKFNRKLYLKWPNDIIYKNKKISGILIEREFKGNILKSLVVGIGINLFTDFQKILHFKDTAISLKDITRKNIEKEIIMINFLKLFEKYYNCFSDWKKVIIKKYMKNISGKNKKIHFKIAGNLIKGKLKKVNHDGSIVIKSLRQEATYSFGEIL